MTAFESQAVFRPRNQIVELNGSPQQIRGMLVTPSWFRLLRVSSALGRAFTEEDGEIGSDQKVILSHGLARYRCTRCLRRPCSSRHVRRPHGCTAIRIAHGSSYHNEP